MTPTPNIDGPPNAQTSHLGGRDSHSMDLLHASCYMESRRSGPAQRKWSGELVLCRLRDFPPSPVAGPMAPYMCHVPASCNLQTADGLKLESALKLRTSNPISNASQVLQRARKCPIIFKVEQLLVQKNSRRIATSGIPSSLAPRILQCGRAWC
jgi:hypothetical protein